MEEIKNIDPNNIVYSDETGIDDDEVVMTGWSLRGERCYSKKKANRTNRYNITAALNMGALFAPFIFQGYSNQYVYEVYIEKVLIPKLRPGMVFIIDNASFHKSKKTIQLIESVGCRVLFLPPYSPDLNPIEHFWSSIKHLIRKASSVSKDFYKSSIEILGNLCAS